MLCSAKTALSGLQGTQDSFAYRRGKGSVNCPLMSGQSRGAAGEGQLGWSPSGPFTTCLAALTRVDRAGGDD